MARIKPPSPLAGVRIPIQRKIVEHNGSHGKPHNFPVPLCKGPIQRASDTSQASDDPDWQYLRNPGGSYGAKIVYVSDTSDDFTTKKANLFASDEQQRKPRSFANQRRQQVLRWFATYLLRQYGGTEIQCYENNDGAIYVSSNTNEVNRQMLANQSNLFPSFDGPAGNVPQERVARHTFKTARAVQKENSDEGRLKERIRKFGVEVVPEDKTAVAGFHAERRIRKYLNKPLDPTRLAGAKRPCMVCAVALNLGGTPGILYTSTAGLGGASEEDVKTVAEAREYRSHITVNRQGQLIDNYGSDSEDDSY